MTADIGKGPYFAILTPDDDQRLVQEVETIIVTGFRDVFRAAYTKPAVPEDSVDLQRIKFRREICVPWQGKALLVL
jgi:hypothetical protein